VTRNREPARINEPHGNVARDGSSKARRQPRQAPGRRGTVGREGRTRSTTLAHSGAFQATRREGSTIAWIAGRMSAQATIFSGGRPARVCPGIGDE